jgi:FkbM family methyltransferase
MKRVLRTLRVRTRLAKIGVFSFRPFRELQFRSLRIAGRRVKISVLPGEEDAFRQTFIDLYLCDEYGIQELCPRPKYILDIGANIGCFSMIAKLLYPEAVIHAYDPNPALASILHGHLDPLGVDCFPEAVGGLNGNVEFDWSGPGSSLCGHVRPNGLGKTAMVTLGKAAERLGGSIDLLKLDCEGSEWDILSDTEALQRVVSLRMEYHLWAKPNGSLRKLEELLASQGFDVIRAYPKQTDGQQGIVWAERAK